MYKKGIFHRKGKHRNGNVISSTLFGDLCDFVPLPLILLKQPTMEYNNQRRSRTRKNWFRLRERGVCVCYPHYRYLLSPSQSFIALDPLPTILLNRKSWIAQVQLKLLQFSLFPHVWILFFRTLRGPTSAPPSQDARCWVLDSVLRVQEDLFGSRTYYLVALSGGAGGR